MIVAQALVERGMLETLAHAVMGVPAAIEAQLGPGNAKWVIGALLVAFLFWAFGPRR